MTLRVAGKTGVLSALCAGLLIASTQVPLAQQPAPQPVPGAAAATGRGGGRSAIDPRVQRAYLFTDTNEQLFGGGLPDVYMFKFDNGGRIYSIQAVFTGRVDPGTQIWPDEK